MNNKMTDEKLREILKNGESETVEFKESLDNGALQTIVAFANTKGGQLLVGVRDNSTVKGVTTGKETLTDWTNTIAQATHIQPQITSFIYEEKTIVIVNVAESSIKPVSCKGRHFKRIGKSTRQMTEEDLTRAVLDKCSMTWDEVVDPRITFDDIDLELFQRFRNLCNKKGRRGIPDDEKDTVVLEKLGLIQNKKLLRATLLLFGKKPQRCYPQSRIKIGRFRSGNIIVDDREIQGSLFHQVETAMTYFREHLQTKFEFEGKPNRDVIWEYPLNALREAIINAVCHRDYLDNGDIQIRWYDDHLIFLNPGGLPEAIRLEELKEYHRSIPRNCKIAEIFFYAGLIERWGSGTLKIIQESTKIGLPEPQFAEKQGALWLTFRKNILTQEYLESLSLNERQIKAVLHIKKKGRITNSDYQKEFKVSKRTASNDLVELEEKGIFERIGTTGRSTSYCLKNKGAIKGQ